MGFIEKFSYLIAEDGKFKKYLKVLLNEEQNKIWIDIRLFFEDHPTKHGVTINQLEYFNLADMLKGIHLKQTINEKRSNDPTRELRLLKIDDFIWVLDLIKTVSGVSKQIKISAKDIAKLYALDQSGDKLYEEYCTIKTGN
jgi:hypothetical protein